MKPKRKLKNWVRVALLLLPEVMIVGLLFFIAVNLKEKTKEINVQVHCPGDEIIIWSEQYE
jgi:hypothetical protein